MILSFYLLHIWTNEINGKIQKQSDLMSQYRVDDQGLKDLYSLIQNQKNSLISILKHDYIMIALKKMVPFLLDYLIDKSGGIVEIAINLANDPDSKLQKTAIDILTFQNSSFSLRLCENPGFVNSLNSFITNYQGKSNSAASSFCKVFLFSVKVSKYKILKSFPDRDILMTKLIRLSYFSSFYNIISVFSEEQDPNMISFLEETNGFDSLFALLKSNVEYSERILFVVQKIVSSLENGSPLLSSFVSNSLIEFIFEIGYNSPARRVTSLVFKVFRDINNILLLNGSEEREADSLFCTTFPIFLSHASKIVILVCSQSPFTEEKVAAVEFLITLSELNNGTLPELLPILEFLFNSIFRYPNNCFLHSSYLSLMRNTSLNISMFESFLERSNVCCIIANEYQTLKFVPYSGFLFQTASIINIRLGDDYGDDQWKSFINNIFIQRKTILNSKYGSQDLDSSDDGMIDDYISPREAAILLFGDSLFADDEEEM